MNNKEKLRVLAAGGTNTGKTSVCLGLARKNIYTASSASGKMKVNTEEYSYNGKKYTLFDTPGYYNLLNASEDDQKTKEILLAGRADAILHVANARHIFRSLLMAIELIEFDLPVVMALNMTDEAEKFGNKLDIESLSEQLGIPIAPTIANIGDGVETLKKPISKRKKSLLTMRYNLSIEKAFDEIRETIEPEVTFTRGLGLFILNNDSMALNMLKIALTDKKIVELQSIISSLTGDISLMVMAARSKFIERVLSVSLKKEEITKIPLLEKIGTLSTHKVYGFIILGFVLAFLYFFIGRLGAEFIADFLDQTLFGGYINPFLTKLAGYIPSEFIQEALVGNYGMLTTGLGTALAIILPIIVTFFFAFSFLEDLGYMPRLSVLLNSAFKKMGLNGKAILPMILGFSCVTMATISTRVLEEKKERIITILMLVLVIPCSAKLSVIIAMLARVSLVSTLILVAILLLMMFATGYASSKLIPGEKSDFIMEIFPLRIPSLKAVLYKTYKRSMWFLDEALPFFIYGMFCLFLLDKIGTLKFLEDLFSPLVVNWLNLPPKFTDAYLLSFFRGEAGIIVLRDMAIPGHGYSGELLTPIQIVVSTLVIILSIPCLTTLLVIIKEYGLKFGLLLVALIMPLSLFIGVVVNFLLRLLPAGLF